MATEPNRRKPVRIRKDANARNASVALKQAATEMMDNAQYLFLSKRKLDEEASNLREKRDVLVGRSTEKLIADAVLMYLSDVSRGHATISEIKQAIPDFVPLTAADLSPSQTRESEALWEQQVRNIVSHREVPGNYIHDGLLRYFGTGRLKLTDAGKQHLEKLRSTDDTFVEGGKFSSLKFLTRSMG